MSDRDSDADEEQSEVAARFAEEERGRAAREAEEWKEYEEMRREEKAKEDEEIQLLREKKERRKKERAEEELRLAGLRAEEDRKRRAEEEERQARKREEENKRREERERKRKELEENKERMGKPNFVITKKSGGEIAANPKRSVMNKTKEQLESERAAALEQRIKPLEISGFDEDKLREKAKELHDRLYWLESAKYDTEQTLKRRQADMSELAERARQMNKGGKQKKQAENVDVEDKLAEKLTGIPPKLTMYSQYERIMDRRSYGEKRVIYAGPQYGEPYNRVMPQYKVAWGEAGYEFTEALSAEGAANGAATEAAATAEE